MGGVDKIQGFIVRAPLFEKGEVNFDYLPRRAEESERFKKLGESMVQEQVFLKEGGWHFCNLIFSMLVSFICRNYFTLCKTVLCI